MSWSGISDSDTWVYSHNCSSQHTVVPREVRRCRMQTICHITWHGSSLATAWKPNAQVQPRHATPPRGQSRWCTESCAREKARFRAYQMLHKSVRSAASGIVIRLPVAVKMLLLVSGGL